jgi:hypothetical protein
MAAATGLSLAATDAAGNVNMTNLSLIQSSLAGRVLPSLGALFYATSPVAVAARRVASVQPARPELAASRRRYSWLFFC